MILLFVGDAEQVAGIRRWAALIVSLFTFLCRFCSG